jgi:LPS sulfotransferase NodH
MNRADRVRAILLTTQRTGSTFLIECLNSHPDIEATGELLIGSPPSYRFQPITKGRLRPLAKAWRFMREGAWMPRRHMDRFFNGGQARVRLFKAMYNHVSNPITLGYLRERTDIRILHLRRHNLLKMYVSRKLMGSGKRVQSWKPLEAAQVHIDPEEALAAMRSVRSRYQYFEDTFAAHPRLQLVYEDLIAQQSIDPKITRSICDFLGVQRAVMKSRLVKMNPEPLVRIVTNFRELASAISRTEFADLLDM